MLRLSQKVSSTVLGISHFISDNQHFTWPLKAINVNHPIDQLLRQNNEDTAGPANLVHLGNRLSAIG
ncbi:hypothetical protein ES703_89368 [subsurface metagenome]